LALMLSGCSLEQDPLKARYEAGYARAHALHVASQANESTACDRLLVEEFGNDRGGSLGRGTAEEKLYWAGCMDALSGKPMVIDSGKLTLITEEPPVQD